MFGRNHKNQGAVEKSKAVGRAALGAAAIGAIATGAFALGALAIGAVTVGRMSMGCGRIRHLEIDELIVGKLTIREETREQ
jgi:hypothetical protein